MWRSSFLPSFMDSLCRVINKIMYVLLWRTVYALTRVCTHSGNKHQNNTLVSAWTVLLASTYIILYVSTLATSDSPRASYQIRKIVGCACAGNAGSVFPRHRLQRKPLVSDPGMHHGTCITHVPWCLSVSLTRDCEENVPGISGACAFRNCTYLVRGPCIMLLYVCNQV